jgi:hypothetical protein
MTPVLPEPAPARIICGPVVYSTASFCAFDSCIGGIRYDKRGGRSNWDKYDIDDICKF